MIEIYDVWLKDPEDGFIRYGCVLKADLEQIRKYFRSVVCGSAVILL